MLENNNNNENKKSFNEFYKKFLLCNKNKIEIFSYNKNKHIKSNYINIHNIFKNENINNYIFYFSYEFKQIVILFKNDKKIKYSLRFNNVNTNKLYDYLENKNMLNYKNISIIKE